MVLSLDQRLNNELKEIATKVRRILEETLPTAKKPEKLYQASTHLIKAGGKMLRPYLVVKSCEAVGGDEESALPVAVAIELLHTFTLIHDDILDNDKVRRGVPSVHVKWNIPLAIIAGDLLFTNVFKTITDGLKAKKIQSQKIIESVGVITETAVAICEGQTLDMEFSMKEDVSEEEYMVMISKKTACLFRAGAEMGALMGGGSEFQRDKLGTFAEYSGMAFQIADDVLGLVADEEELGKPVGSDLREGKKSLPIIDALRKADQNQKKTILAAMKKTSTQKEILQVRNLIKDMGSINYSMKKAEEYLEKALKQLEFLPENEAKKSLANLAEFIIKRRF